ncbi:MAG TPA: hypothetical protein VF450_22410 [Noviherbaspirillum sp.]
MLLPTGGCHSFMPGMATRACPSLSQHVPALSQCAVMALQALSAIKLDSRYRFNIDYRQAVQQPAQVFSVRRNGTDDGNPMI